MILVKLNKQIEKLMVEALAREGQYALKNASRRIKSKMKNIVYDAISDCPEMEELSRYNGKLRLDFGLSSDPTPDIIDGIVNSVFVEVRKVSEYNLSDPKDLERMKQDNNSEETKKREEEKRKVEGQIVSAINSTYNQSLIKNNLK